MREQLKYNRYLATMQGGYSVANGMKEAIHYLQHGELHIDEVSGILFVQMDYFTQIGHSNKLLHI